MVRSTWIALPSYAPRRTSLPTPSVGPPCCTMPSSSGGMSRCRSCGPSRSRAPPAQLDQLRLRALEERIDADLALGRDATLVTELEALVAEHPYREGLRAQLMLTLYRSGRQAGALDVYQAGRRTLQDDLGLQPGKELRDLEAAILRQDEALSVARPVPAEPEPEAEQPPPAGRLSRRAVIAACIAALLRSRSVRALPSFGRARGAPRRSNRDRLASSIP